MHKMQVSKGFENNIETFCPADLGEATLRASLWICHCVQLRTLRTANCQKWGCPPQVPPVQRLPRRSNARRSYFGEKWRVLSAATNGRVNRLGRLRGVVATYPSVMGERQRQHMYTLHARNFFVHGALYMTAAILRDEPHATHAEFFLPARRYAARHCSCGPVSVCPCLSLISWSSIETSGRIELVFGFLRPNLYTALTA